MNNMYIRYFIAILCVFSSTYLIAQDKQTVKSKVTAKTVISKDTLKSSEQISLPFGKGTINSVASDISVFNTEDLLRSDNINSLDELLSGRLPGGINFRGIGNALIVVDGVPRPKADINVSEIEQITILKDANAGMLYGVMANNGVILIKTKRGVAKKNKISTLVEYGLGSPISFPKYLGSADYMKLYNEAQANDGVAPTYSAAKIQGSQDGTDPYRYPDANYYNSTFLKKFKPSSRVETQFSGGNDNAQYYANLGWQRTGSLINLGDKIHTDKLNLRTNLDFRINDFITSYVDLSTVFNIASVPNGDFFLDASNLKPNYYPPLIDTALINDRSLIKTARKINGKYILGGTSQYKNNIYGNLLLGGYNKQFNTTSMFDAGLNFDLKAILKGLTFKAYASFDFNAIYNQTQSNTYAVYELKSAIGKINPDSLYVTKIGVDKNSGTQGLNKASTVRDYAYTGILDYSPVMTGKHSFSATLMAYFDKRNVSGIYQTDKHSHVGGRLNYVYNSKYIVDFTSALVSSPKLPSDNRYGFSPSASLGWVVSNEKFLKNSPLINYLKLTASAGIINTDMSLGRYYMYEDVMGLGATYNWGDAYRWNNATTFTNVGNDQLFFEKRKEYNVGFETALLNNSLWIDANYFNESKTDQIVIGGLANTFPSFLGGINPAQNYNEDNFKGVELSVTYKKSVGPVNFEISPNLLYLETKVVKKDEFYGWDYLYHSGRSTGAIFGLEAEGFFKDNADIANHAYQLFGTVKPGDIKYKDQNGDHVIDANDEKMIGDGSSKWQGGLSFKLNYKNFTLFAIGSVRNGAQTIFKSSYFWVSGDTRYSDVVLNRWTPATAETATYPRLSSKANTNNFRNSTFWIEDNSLISLDRVQLTYDLPKSISKKLSTNNFSLYVRGSNLANFAPNKDKMELSAGTEPQYRYFAAGLKILF